MTTPSKPAKSDARHWVIAILVGVIVLGAVNLATQSGLGYLFAPLAGALAWQIFRPRSRQP